MSNINVVQKNWRWSRRQSATFDTTECWIFKTARFQMVKEIDISTVMSHLKNCKIMMIPVNALVGSDLKCHSLIVNGARLRISSSIKNSLREWGAAVMLWRGRVRFGIVLLPLLLAGFCFPTARFAHTAQDTRGGEHQQRRRHHHCYADAHKDAHHLCPVPHHRGSRVSQFVSARTFVIVSQEDIPV